MGIFKKKNLTVIAFFMAFVLSACEKDVIPTYGVNPVSVEDESLLKFKKKTPKQYISILYTDLFKEAISVNKLASTERVIESVGDKALVHEIIVSNYMNHPDVTIPADTFMRNNLDTFISLTYRKFYLRQPSQIERSFFKEYISNNPNVTVELVYVAFAASDEYQFY